MGSTRSHYAKRAISRLFHMKSWYGSEPGVIRRVVCYRNAGIFVVNNVSKLSSFPHPLPASPLPPFPLNSIV